MSSTARSFRAAVMLLLAGMLATLIGWGTATTARADDPTVAITLTSVSPGTLTPEALNDPNQRLTISGSVVNNSGKKMRRVQVLLWRSVDPITDATDLTRTLTSPWDFPIGARMTDFNDKNTYNITVEEENWEPGGKANFAVSAKMTDLGFTDRAATYLVGVHVRAITEDEPNRTVGRARVLMPMVTPKTSGQLSPVVVLSSAPSLLPSGQFSDDHLATDLAGRLDKLLQLAEQPGSTVLIDPSLLDELTIMSKGYETLEGTDTSTGKRLATQWLKRWEAVAGTPDVYRLPFANPDLLAAAHAGRGEVIDRLLKASSPRHSLASKPLAIMTTSGAIDQTLIDFVAPLKPALFFGKGSSAGLFDMNNARALLFDPGVMTGGPGPAPSNTPAQVSGRFLSQLALGSGRPIVQKVDDLTSAKVITDRPAWVSLTGVGAMKSNGFMSFSAGEAEPGSARLYDVLNRAQESQIAWGDLTGATQNAELLAAEVCSRALSQHLDANQKFEWLAKASISEASDLKTLDITLSAAKSFVMSSHTLPLPISITNNLDVPVKVKVRFISENPQRIAVPETELLTLKPKEQLSLNFEPQAVTNGEVDVVAQLVTEGGRPVGHERNFTLIATNLGDVGWIIILASGFVLVAASGWRIKQVQRERAKKAAEVAAAEENPYPTQSPGPRPHP